MTAASSRLAGLTALMGYEKVGRQGTVVARVAGVARPVVAGFVLVRSVPTPSGAIHLH